jgi:hypothetical protein
VPKTQNHFIIDYLNDTNPGWVECPSGSHKAFVPPEF